MSLSTSPQSGLGISLSWKTASGGTFASLVQLLDDAEFDGFDTTIINLPTLAVGTMAKAPGRTDNGTFTGSCYLVFADAGVTELMALGSSKATIYWQVMLNDGSSPTTGSTYAFQGFISNLKPGNFSGDDAPHLDFTIAISGAITATAGT